MLAIACRCLLLLALLAPNTRRLRPTDPDLVLGELCSTLSVLERSNDSADLDQRATLGKSSRFQLATAVLSISNENHLLKGGQRRDYDSEMMKGTNDIVSEEMIDLDFGDLTTCLEMITVGDRRFAPKVRKGHANEEDFEGGLLRY
ncbi:hypothetical protein BJ742DRAFT_738200 [Cladochytrium replicatum]|nr:hypothetical protein BJ742DRAFT_738200 [Cladochytrium replicatum]